MRAQFLEIRRNLPRKYYEELPALSAGRWRRYPRVYVLARDFVTHTAGRFDQESLRRFAEAYQEVTPLSIGELWAIPIMLRVALVENLCGLAVQTLRAKQEREAARAFAASLVAQSERTKTPLQLAAKASSTFVVEILHSLRDQSVGSTAAWRWLQTRLSARGQSPDELLRSEQQREAIDQLSIANIIGTMRVLSALDWPLFVESVSRVERVLRKDPAAAYADMDLPTRDRYRKSVEQLSKRSGIDEIEIAGARGAYGGSGTGREPGSRSNASRRVLPDFARARFELEKAVGYAPTIGERISRVGVQASGAVLSGNPRGHDGAVRGQLASIRTQSGCLAPLFDGPGRMSHAAAGQRTRPEPSQYDPDHDRAAATAAEARASQGNSGCDENDRCRAHDPLVGGAGAGACGRAGSAGLANHEDNLSFALLGDFADADAETLASDDELTGLAAELIQALNQQ